MQSIVGSLYEKALDEYGRTMYRARCKKVLVAGDWRPGSCDDCPHPCDREKRSDCKGVLLTPYVSYRQIFGIPNSEDYEEHEAATNTEDSLASEAEL